MNDQWVSLTFAERGLFESVVRALLLYGPIKDDPRSVAQRTMALPEDYAFIEEAWPKIRAFLLPGDDGRLSDPEVDVAKAESAAYLAQKRESGKRGGRPPGKPEVKQRLSETEPPLKQRLPIQEPPLKLCLTQFSTLQNTTEQVFDPPLSNPRPEPSASEACQLHDAFNAFIDNWPNPENSDSACRQWVSLVGTGDITAEELPKVMAGLEAYKASARWHDDGGKWAMNPQKWLMEKRWKDRPRMAEEVKVAASSNREWTGSNANEEYLGRDYYKAQKLAKAAAEAKAQEERKAA